MSTESHFIGQRAAQSHYHAREQAERIGFPLTHMVTINYASTNVDPRLAVRSFAKLRRDRFQKWAARPSKGQGDAFPATYAFTFENTRDGVAFERMEPGGPHNVHVHWLVHLPAGRVFDFEGRVWDWVGETAGGIHGGAETIHIGPLPDGGYLMKGVDKKWAQLYTRGRKPEPQGIIVGGRRADTSRNIGRSVRRAADAAAGIDRRYRMRRDIRQSGSASAPTAPTP